MMSEAQVIKNAKGTLKNAERVLQAANEQIDRLVSTSPGAKAKGVEAQPAIVPASTGKGLNKGAAKSRPPPPPPHRPRQNVNKKLLMARMKAIGKQRSTNGAHLNQMGSSSHLWRPPAGRDGSWNQDVVYGRPF